MILSSLAITCLDNILNLSPDIMKHLNFSILLWKLENIATILTLANKWTVICNVQLKTNEDPSYDTFLKMFRQNVNSALQFSKDQNK